MRIALILAPALALAGCSIGQPASLTPASRQAIAPVQTFGFHPAVQQGLEIPIDTAGCIVDTAMKIVDDAKDGAKCIIRTLFPAVVPPQSVIQTGPRSAPCGPVAPSYAPAPPPAPRSTPPCEPVAACANGNCAR